MPFIDTISPSAAEGPIREMYDRVRSTYCSLPHGRVLAEKVFDTATAASVARGDDAARLEPAELAMMAFVETISIQHCARR